MGSALAWPNQGFAWGLPGEEIEAPWVLCCSDRHHKHVFWGDALLPKMKAGGRKFPSFSKGGAQQHSVCVQGHRGSSKGCSGSLICPQL